MFSATEEQESSDDATRGLGRWFEVVKPEKRRFEKPGKSMFMEEEMVEVATSIPKAEFLRITRKLTRDTGSSASDMDLCTATQVVPTPLQFVRQENEVPGASDDPLLNDLSDPAATPIG